MLKIKINHVRVETKLNLKIFAKREDCPVPAVLVFQMLCPGHLVHCSPDTAVISWQSCHLCPFQPHLYRLTSLG
jgi:hypothetical protein